MRKIDTPELRTFIIYAQLQHMPISDTLDYLHDHGHDISIATLDRIKKKIKNDRFSAMTQLALNGFMVQHLERIDQLELITKELWVQYNAESQPHKKAEILQMIAQIQPLISQYHEASREVMENQVRDPYHKIGKHKEQEAEHTELLDEFLGKPFYCWNTTLFGIHDCCFNHMIGLPEKNNKEYPFFEYQREIYDALEAHEHVWIKKAKGIGGTTFIIRYLLWKILVNNALADKNIFIISNTQEFANKVKERLELLFRRAYPNLRVKSKYTEAWIKSTWIKVFPSRNIQDMRGYIDVAYIFVDESDFFQPIEQDELESVIKAYEEKSHGQNILCSTPNKPDNLFYKIEYDNAFGKDYFHKIFLDYRKGLGKIYDDEFIMWK